MATFDPSNRDVAERWRALWAASPQRSPFSDPFYVCAVADAAGLRLNVHFITSEAGDVAAAAVTWRRRGPYREAVVPPLTPFSALLLAWPTREADVHARTSVEERLLDDIAASYDAATLHFPPELTDVRPAQWSGWSVEPLYTYRIALADADTEAWSSSTARNLRSARGEFELVQGVDAVETAVRLAASSYDRSGRTLPLKRETLLVLAERMVAADMASAFAVRREATDEIEAGVVILHDETQAYYWIAGSKPGDAMTVLIGELLHTLEASGRKSFDFVGANTPGVAEFKRRFGSELVPYFRLACVRRLDLKILYTFRKMFG